MAEVESVSLLSGEKVIEARALTPILRIAKLLVGRICNGRVTFTTQLFQQNHLAGNSLASTAKLPKIWPDSTSRAADIRAPENSSLI